jgi:hypothetical protein
MLAGMQDYSNIPAQTIPHMRRQMSCSKQYYTLQINQRAFFLALRNWLRMRLLMVAIIFSVKGV